MTTHEDNRRKLTSFPEGKLLEIKQDCVIGKHYHKVKTEYFVLVRGECVIKFFNATTQNVIENYPMTIGSMMPAYPNTYHEFHIKAGSILLGLCSHPYDPKDDYHL